mmetsp:Transcript_144610/g.265500  ORF Transcript_144610/g.265500 Transcript_144610/m.265500 type:complete len:159 (-) Transcript_144610:776-1252(-)
MCLYNNNNKGLCESSWRSSVALRTQLYKSKNEFGAVLHYLTKFEKAFASTGWPATSNQESDTNCCNTPGGILISLPFFINICPIAIASASALHDFISLKNCMMFSKGIASSTCSTDFRRTTVVCNSTGSPLHMMLSQMMSTVGSGKMLTKSVRNHCCK